MEEPVMGVVGWGGTRPTSELVFYLTFLTNIQISGTFSLFLTAVVLCGSLGWHFKYTCMTLNNFFQCSIWVDSRSFHPQLGRPQIG